MNKQEIMQQLNEIAYKKTSPFCYGCYRTAPTGACSRCHSDDLMRELDGYGVEYGTDWVIPHIVDEEVEKIDVEEAFISSIEDCYYEPVKIGWIEVDPVYVLKNLYPYDFRMAKDEWIMFEEEDDRIIEIGDNYYSVDDIEQFISRNN